MPLRKGSSQSVVSSNIKTLVNEWKKDGSIGTSHPPTKKKAIKSAVLMDPVIVATDRDLAFIAAVKTNQWNREESVRTLA
jgi:hypothetical protein